MTGPCTSQSAVSTILVPRGSLLGLEPSPCTPASPVALQVLGLGSVGSLAYLLHMACNSL